MVALIIQCDCTIMHLEVFVTVCIYQLFIYLKCIYINFDFFSHLKTGTGMPGSTGSYIFTVLTYFMARRVQGTLCTLY